MAKRYVLLVADRDLLDEDKRDLSLILESKYGKVTIISVKNPKAVIVKTTSSVAPLLREMSGRLHIRGKGLSTILTSGSIGKLKKRASESETT